LRQGLEDCAQLLGALKPWRPGPSGPGWPALRASSRSWLARTAAASRPCS
jgi:hypothetical protein